MKHYPQGRPGLGARFGVGGRRGWPEAGLAGVCVRGAFCSAGRPCLLTFFIFLRRVALLKSLSRGFRTLDPVPCVFLQKSAAIMIGLLQMPKTAAMKKSLFINIIDKFTWLMECGHPVVIMWSSCVHPVVIMCSSCAHDALIMRHNLILKILFHTRSSAISGFMLYLAIFIELLTYLIIHVLT